MNPLKDEIKDLANSRIVWFVMGLFLAGSKPEAILIAIRGLMGV